ncbi:Uncharacterized protein dnm_095570 [Desulfonema magnum]|uniref:Uncharacterized protein n=1 Tax=Desulfonema magnum TaxID=45655 RepID=A0A975BX74_9BACT|nr:Uncharacterized protein dnm_095570 [Desulfonema magnum]
MPKLIPSKKFVKDINKFQSDVTMRKKLPKRYLSLKKTRFIPV